MGEWYYLITDRLEGISSRERRFEAMAKIAGRFVEANGRAPSLYDKFDGEPIGRWLAGMKPHLSPKREAILEREMGPHFAASFRPRFAESVQAIAAFRAAHGTWPQHCKSDDPEVQAEARRLGLFLRNRQQDCKKGLLSEEHALALDERLPGWRPAFSSHEEKWDAQLTHATTWVQKHGRWPLRAAPRTEENTLALWLYRQHQQLRRSRLSHRRLAALDDALPGWKPAELRAADGTDLAFEPTASEQEREAAWNETLRQVCTFVACEQRLPRNLRKGPRSSTEERLFWWLERCLRQAVAGRLGSEREKRLEAAIPEWQRRMRPGAGQKQRATWQRTLDCLAQFYAAEGRCPMFNELHDGVAVGAWLNNQRRALKNGTLLPERRQELDEAVPGWDLLRLSV